MSEIRTEMFSKHVRLIKEDKCINFKTDTYRYATFITPYHLSVLLMNLINLRDIDIGTNFIKWQYLFYIATTHFTSQQYL